ncbi:hypothetical protein [Nonomuraea dietziae]|uniref:hypothetical protein n=1 Tax=Nonomuraea dietziae TaxID=65515 RepID=UPI00342226A8
MYPTCNPLAALRQAPPGVAVLARPYQRALAQQRGVLATMPGADGALVMVDLVEKPNPETARALEELYGPDRLMLLEGRARVDDDFVDYARAHTCGEPKLSLALASYARIRPVYVVSTTTRVIDLGAPAAAG